MMILWLSTLQDAPSGSVSLNGWWFAGWAVALLVLGVLGAARVPSESWSREDD